jgi:hypothetical protein
VATPAPRPRAYLTDYLTVFPDLAPERPEVGGSFLRSVTPSC